MPVSPKHHAGSDGERSVTSGKQKALLSPITAVLFLPEDDKGCTGRAEHSALQAFLCCCAFTVPFSRFPLEMSQIAEAQWPPCEYRE